MGRAVAATAKAHRQQNTSAKKKEVAGRETQREIARALHSQERKNSFFDGMSVDVSEEKNESEAGVTVKSPKRSIWAVLHPHKNSLNAKERMALQKSLEERGEYTQKEINALTKVQYRIRCRRQKTRSVKIKRFCKRAASDRY